jgi:RIO kinase 1
LSEFNVLLSEGGPVIIDLPQAIQSTANNAFRLFQRDINNLAAYFARFAPEIKKTDYAHEIWKLYESGKLKPDTKLTGKFTHSTKRADVRGVLNEIDAAYEEEMRKRLARRGDHD